MSIPTIADTPLRYGSGTAFDVRQGLPGPRLIAAAVTHLQLIYQFLFRFDAPILTHTAHRTGAEMRLISLILAGVTICGIVAAAMYSDFASRTNGSVYADELPGAAIVFTGQFDRVQTGLDVLSAGRVDRLFITGVNSRAGLDAARFAEQFQLSAEQDEWMETGRIILATNANSTFENALETECWLENHPGIQAVTLITSQRHMARASLALERAVARVAVVRLVSDPLREPVTFGNQASEFRKFVATWFITLLPRTLWPADQAALCGSDRSEQAFRLTDMLIEGA